MQTNSAVHPSSETAVLTTRKLIHDPSFCCRHRAREKDFTRRRKLTFMNTLVLVMQKTVRSIQLHLNDFFASLALDSQTVNASSWCEARIKLRHTAFIELNERAILDVIYGDKSDPGVRRWKAHRLIAIDSSLVRLPDEEALGQEFGWVQCSNQEGLLGRYPQARLLALTDVLNRIVLKTIFVPWQQGERELAAQYIKVLAPEDIGLLDRGFASYELWARFVAQNRQFVCRCAASSFSIVNRLFQENQAGRSVTVTLRPQGQKQAQMEQEGLLKEITVRFVTVRLSTGELEVLATNLLDEQTYPTAEFAELYHQRWGIETYYGLIKSRLDLENFSGLSVEAVRQDVHATIFLSNLESILIQPVQETLWQKSEHLQHRQQVNHAVSFHTIKSHMIRLLLSHQPISEVLAKLQELCSLNPVSKRPERIVPRRKPSAWRSYNYQRNVKKVVF